MAYRVNQVRNVMVHATPRTLTNRFLPLYPRWAGSHIPHTDQAKKVPRYTSMRFTQIKTRKVRAKEDCKTNHRGRARERKCINAGSPRSFFFTPFGFSIFAEYCVCDRLILYAALLWGCDLWTGGGKLWALYLVLQWSPRNKRKGDREGFNSRIILKCGISLYVSLFFQLFVSSKAGLCFKACKHREW